MRHGGSLLLCVSGWLWCSLAAAGPRQMDEELVVRNAVAFAEFQVVYLKVVQRVNERFGIDYLALDRLYDPLYREYHDKRAIVAAIQDEQTRMRELSALEERFQTPEARRYMEARLFLDNELDREHLLKARRLQACEEILEALIASDPLLRHCFHSPEFQGRYGLLLKRAVWGLPEGLSATAKPLGPYTMFADRTRMPMLISVSPKAFGSLPYLRSTLIHELNHVLLDKEPPYAGLQRMPQSAPKTTAPPPSRRYARYFMTRHGRSASYQYYVIQEYYSFVAQLLYDDRVRADPHRRLAPEERRYTEQLRDWAFEQLSPEQQAFIQRHPEPPLAPYLKAYVPQDAHGTAEPHAPAAGGEGTR